MKLALVIARVLMALIYLLYGLNFFLHFFHAALPPGRAGDFEGGLIRSGYFFEYMKSMQIAAGILLFANRYVLLITVIMFPISINIFLFHAFLLTRGIVVAALLLSANGFLLYAFRKYYMALLTPVAKV